MLKLADIRKDNNMTQAYLAQCLMISAKRIGAWEQSHAEPSIKDLIMLADFFKITIDYLVGRENEAGIINTDANLTDDEKDLLTAYRQLNYFRKNQALGFLKGLAY
jgi:transcriptional regulator with XRE-family HTH domain